MITAPEKSTRLWGSNLIFKTAMKPAETRRLRITNNCKWKKKSNHKKMSK